jgi:hypothetical protein
MEGVTILVTDNKMYYTIVYDSQIVIVNSVKSILLWWLTPTI